MPEPGPHQLDYAPPPQRTWPAALAKWLRRVIVTASVVVIAVLLFRAAQPRIRQMQLQIKFAPARAAAFAKCLTHTYPAATVIFDEAVDVSQVTDGLGRILKQAIRRPIANSQRWRLTHPSNTAVFSGVMWPNPRTGFGTSSWNEVCAINFRPWPYDVACQHGLRPSKFFNQLGPNLHPDWADEVFLHGRRPPDGVESVVAIGFNALDFVAGSDAPFRAQIARSQGSLRPLRIVASGDAFGFRFIIDPSETLTLYAGQVDANDESHFTIDYATPKGRGTIDGWLQADDTVKLQVRSGPAKR